MSTTATSILSRLDIPTKSFIMAAQAAMSYRDRYDLHNYNEVLSEFTGNIVAHEELPIAQMTFGYFVQELVRSLNGEPKSIDDLYVIASDKAKQFVEREPWHWQCRENNVRILRLEEIKRYAVMFEGVNRDALIERVAADFEITKATAATYLRQLDKVDEDTETAPKAEKKPKINKGAEAAKLMAEHFTGSNKEQMLEMISKQLDTSRGGAQTFFYAAIKTLNLKVDKGRASGELSTQDKLKPILEADPSIDKASFIEAAEKLGIKRTTAQTYYYSLTSNMGVERQGTTARGRKKAGGLSRADQVVEFLKAHPGVAKDQLLDMLSQHFNVSKISAQSYYYAAKKAI